MSDLRKSAEATVDNYGRRSGQALSRASLQIQGHVNDVFSLLERLFLRESSLFY